MFQYLHGKTFFCQALHDTYLQNKNKKDTKLALRACPLCQTQAQIGNAKPGTLLEGNSEHLHLFCQHPKIVLFLLLLTAQK